MNQPGLPPPNPARKWKITPLLWLTLILHMGLPLAAFLQPTYWTAAIVLLILNQLTVTAAGLWPRCKLLGPNWTRLPGSAAQAGQIAITIDDGPDPEVTPKVLDLLDHFHAKATFFCIGALAERHSDLCREIVRRGHAVENHSQHHRHHFAAFGPKRMAKEIEDGQDTLARITGIRPLFFRPTAGLRSPFLEPILARNGLTLASWTKRGYDTRNRDADNVYTKLTSNLAAGDILLVHDGNAARTHDGQPIILNVLPRLLKAITEAGLNTVTLRSATLFPY